MPNVVFDSPVVSSGVVVFDSPVIPDGPSAPTILSQPSNQAGVFDVAQTYDASVHFSGAASYSFATAPPTGVTIDGTTGIISRATQALASNLAIPQVTGYASAGQTGPNDSLNAFTWEVAYALAAVLGDAQGGYYVEPTGLLNGLNSSHIVAGATYAVTTAPTGWTIDARAGGDATITPVGATDGAYSIISTVWDGSTNLTTTYTYTVDNSLPDINTTIPQGIISVNGWEPDGNPGQFTQVGQGSVNVQGLAPSSALAGAFSTPVAQGTVTILTYAPSGLLFANQSSPGQGAFSIMGLIPDNYFSEIYARSSRHMIDTGV